MVNKIHSVKYNFIMNFILTASGFIFPLITFPYVSRILGASGNGTIAFVGSIANYFAMVASLGIPTYGIRACARVRDDKEMLSKTVHEIFFINLITTCFVLLTFFLVILLVPKFSSEKTLFYINGLNILLNLFGINWLYQAMEQYDYITFRSLFFKCISIILMFAFVHDSNDYVVYAFITVFASAGSNILNFIRVKKIISFQKFENYNLRKHIKPILVLFAQNIVVSVYTNLDTVMLGFITNNTQVGLYSAAVKLKGILLSLVSSLGNVLLPRMSYYVKNNLKDEFLNMMKKAINFSLLLSIPLSVYFVLNSREILLFLAGKEYIGATLAMQFITIAIIPNALTGVLGVQVLTSMGKERYVLISVVVAAITDILLNAILIPFFGASGASFATMIAEFLVLFIQIYYVKKVLKVKIFNVNEIVKIFICSALPIMFIFILKNLSINLFLTLSLSAVLYFGIGLMLCKFFNVVIITDIFTHKK